MSTWRAPRSPALAPFVESLGYYEGTMPSARERVLPTAQMGLMVNLHENEMRIYDGPEPGAKVHRFSGAVLGGAQSLPRVIDTDEQRCIVSVQFRFGGAAPFMRMPAEACRDTLVNLQDAWPDGDDLRDRLLEAPNAEAKLCVLEEALLEHVVGTAEPDRGIRWAVAALENGERVADVAEALGWLPKRFAGRFREQVGLTPKRFARVRRLQQVIRGVSGAGQVDWSDVAAEYGYCDQPHLINEFRELAGITPTSYQPRAPGEHNHVPLATE